MTYTTDPVTELADRAGELGELGEPHTLAIGAARAIEASARPPGGMRATPSQLEHGYRQRAKLLMSQDAIDADPAWWKNERRRSGNGQWRLTASEMAAVLHLAPPDHGSAFSLYRQKTTGHDDFEGNDRTDLGLITEPLTAAKFARSHPELELGPGGLFASVDYPWLAATPDRIGYTATLERGHEPACLAQINTSSAQCQCGGTVATYEPAGPVQLKTWAGSRQEFGDEHSAFMPVYYRVQLLVEMIVLGTDRGWLPVMFLPSGRVVTMRIERDDAAEADIAAILAAGEAFVSCLESEQPPAVDWTPACTATLKQMYSGITDERVRVPARLADQYQAARAAAKLAERRLRLAQNRLRERLGFAGVAYALDKDGHEITVCSRSASPRAGYSVDPSDRVETMSPGRWGK
jgi:hypothetical protein